MPKLRTIILILVLVVVGLVVYRLPARWITDRIDIAGLAIDGVSGSVWRGQITGMRFNDKAVAPMRWVLSPVALATGKLAADVEAFPPDGAMSAQLVARRDKTLTATNLAVTGPLQRIAGGTSLGPIIGDLEAEFETLSVSADGLLAARGQASVRQLRYPANAPYLLGDYVITCDDTDGPPVSCGLSDAGRGPLELDAALTLGPASQYELSGRVRARSSAPADIAQSLRFLGRADAEGFYPLEFAGALN